MSSFLRLSTRVVMAAKPQPFMAQATVLRSFHSTARVLSDDETRDFKKKESAQEKEYASRQERATLMEMLARMEREADPGDVKAKKALEQIFSMNNQRTNPKMVEALLKWKHTSNQ